MPINKGLIPRIHCGMKNGHKGCGGIVIYVTDHTFTFFYVQKFSGRESEWLGDLAL